MISFLDRAILALTPQRGLARIKAKAAADVVMNYDGASRGRRTQGWKAPASAADAAAYGARARLRNMSRDMIRNRPLAFRGQSVITGNVVGTGIMPSVNMGKGAGEDDAENALAFLKSHLMTAAIDAHGVNALPGLQTQVMNTVFSDGEILVRRRLRDARFAPDLPLLFQLQLLECDHLDETVTSNGSNEVIEGIEYGPTGTIEAYHLLRHHPGDVKGWGRKLQSERVPAGQILHVRRADRPGQMRGVPWLAPVMLTLGELADYQEAEIIKQRMASLLAFFIKSDEDAPAPDQPAALEEIGPGAVMSLGPGQDVTASEPPSLNGHEAFMRHGAFTVAMGLGITGESLTGDLRGVNFSSGRMGRMEMDRFIQVWQQQLIIDQFCNGVGRWTLQQWALQGRSDRSLPPVPAGLEWTAPRRPLIDPGKEIAAAVAEVNAGFNSRQRKQRELGYDPDTIAKERAEDAARTGAPQTPDTEETT